MSHQPVANVDNHRVATVIPLYTHRLEAVEVRRLRVTLSNAPEGSTYFVGPPGLGMQLPASLREQAQFVPFDAMHFASVRSYNRWVVQPGLYETFAKFEFLLLCQSDALLVRPLPADDAWEFDYLGAPWSPPIVAHWNPLRGRIVSGGPSVIARRLDVGNGGLSLRRTLAFASLKNLPRFRKMPNEDVAISYFGRRIGIRVAPRAIAARFFMETESTQWVAGMPFPGVYGFHALDRFNPALEAALLAASEVG